MEAEFQSIVIADPDIRTRAAIARALERGGYRTRLARTGVEVLELAAAARPAAVILETHLPGESGYEVCRELRERYGEELPIILISATRTDAPDLIAGLLLGADDYVPKPVHADYLLARLRRLTARRARRIRPQDLGLTTREHEVLELLAEGLEPGAIASRLVITPKTVAKHIERILGKLGVHSRAQAVAVLLGGNRAVPERMQRS